MKAQRQAKKEQQAIDRQLKAEAKKSNKKPRKAPIRKPSPKKVVVDLESAKNDAEVIVVYELPRRQRKPTEKVWDNLIR